MNEAEWSSIFKIICYCCLLPIVNVFSITGCNFLVTLTWNIFSFNYNFRWTTQRRKGVLYILQKKKEKKRKCHPNGQQTEPCSDLAIKHIIALSPKVIISFDKPNWNDAIGLGKNTFLITFLSLSSALWTTWLIKMHDWMTK